MDKKIELIGLVNRLEELKTTLLSFKDNLVEELDSLPVGVCLTDEQGNFEKVNKVYARLLNYEKKELTAKHFNMVLSDEELTYFKDKYPKSIQDFSDDKGHLSHLKKKDGSLVPVLFCASTILLGQNTYRLSVVVDITKLREADRQISETLDIFRAQIYNLKSKLKSRELAESILLHDIKKPIRSVLGICDILASEDISQEEMKMWIGTIRDLMHQGLEQADTLHGINRMERGEYTPDLQPLDLLKTIDQYKSSFKSLLNNKNTSLEVVTGEQWLCTKESCSFMADPPYIDLLFSNLITNAVEASAENSTVTVQLRQQEEDILIELHNQGAVPKEIREHFFEKYITAGKDRGTGLGTYIAKLIVNSLGGKIWMETSDEKGTSVFMQFPRTVEQEDSGRQAA